MIGSTADASRALTRRCAIERVRPLTRRPPTTPRQLSGGRGVCGAAPPSGPQLVRRKPEKRPKRRQTPEGVSPAQPGDSPISGTWTPAPVALIILGSWVRAPPAPHDVSCRSGGASTARVEGRTASSGWASIASVFWVGSGWMSSGWMSSGWMAIQAQEWYRGLSAGAGPSVSATPTTAGARGAGRPGSDRVGGHRPARRPRPHGCSVDERMPPRSGVGQIHNELRLSYQGWNR